jgi:O-antigen/teichoic acid export membrane protein
MTPTDTSASAPAGDGESPPLLSEQPRVSLRKRALNGTILTAINHGGQQSLRLVGNLILTRLLFPKAFGLMALVQSFMIGIEMLSDVGTGPSIVHSKRGDDPAFLNTGWTVQVVRGFALWVIASLIAFPAAWFYNEPTLGWMLVAVGSTSALQGFQSTKLFTADRNLTLGRLTVIELGSYMVTLTLTVLLSWWMRSVWALVIGGIFGTALKTASTHLFLPGVRNRFQFDKEAYRELRSFGQWIIVTSTLGYIVMQGDRLVVGRLLDTRFLGIYTVALTFAILPTEVIRQAATKVLFPSYSELMRTAPERLHPMLRKSRLLLLAASWSGCLFMIFAGGWMIHFLYDNRYDDAAWMLPVMSVGTLGLALTLSYDGLLLATGNTRYMAVLLAVQAVVKFSGMIIGYYVGGQVGVIVGLAAVPWLSFPADIWCMRKLGYWQPEIDLPLIGAGGLLAVAAYYVSF